MYSLALAKDLIHSDFLLIEGDIIFEERALEHILKCPERNSLLIVNESGSGDEALVELRDNIVFRISKDFHQLARIDGEFIGLSKISYNTYKAMLTDKLVIGKISTRVGIINE